MVPERRRGVTRGYVAALIVATGIVAVALVVAFWGVIALSTGTEPVMTEPVARWAAPVVIMFALALLAGSLWRQALTLLRGQRSPAWGQLVVTSGGTYLVWCLGGVLAGMSIDDTWMSPYAVALSVAWALANLAFWAVLARRVYTDRPPPRWPWERAEEGEG
ncbi:hypothetical protein ACXR2W_00185 [Leucobacter sp. HY1908]